MTSKETTIHHLQQKRQRIGYSIPLLDELVSRLKQTISSLRRDGSGGEDDPVPPGSSRIVGYDPDRYLIYGEASDMPFAALSRMERRTEEVGDSVEIEA